MTDFNLRRILVADDEPVSLLRTATTLAQLGYAVEPVCDGEQAWAMLQQAHAPRLAILDWQMPGLTGPDICRLVRRQPEERPYTYILLLTVRTQPEDLISGMESGADDYMCKPVRREELQVRLMAGERILGLQKRLLDQQQELHRLAAIDEVTQTYNRRVITKRLADKWERVTTHGEFLSVVLLDLDYFKRINDTYGHLAGDAVLREVSARMLQSVPPGGAIGRYGGEEFLIVLPDVRSNEAAVWAEAIRQKIAGTPIVTADGSVRVSASLGFAEAAGFRDSSDLLRAADAALYRAKQAGRNCVRQALCSAPRLSTTAC